MAFIAFLTKLAFSIFIVSCVLLLFPSFAIFCSVVMNKRLPSKILYIMGIHTFRFIMVRVIRAKDCFKLVLDEVIVEVLTFDKIYPKLIFKVGERAMGAISTVIPLLVIILA